MHALTLTNSECLLKYTVVKFSIVRLGSYSRLRRVVGSPAVDQHSEFRRSFGPPPQIRLKKEQEEEEQKRKEKAEALLYTMEKAGALLYTIIQVAHDEDLLEQIGRDIYFDLVDYEKVRSFRIHKQTPFNLFKEEVAKELGVPVQCQRFWFWAKRKNYTYRPNHPLTPEEEAQSVGQLANNAALKLFLEVEYGQDMRPIPPPIKSKEDILLFFKHYDPLKEELRYVGRLLVKVYGKPMGILTKLNELAGFSPDEEVELFEEIKFEPSVMCERIDKKFTFQSSQLQDGDIICFQKSPQVESSEQCRYPDVPSFLEYVHNRQVVHFRSLEKPKEDEFCLELSKLHNYDDVVERVALQLGLDDPSKIRLTAHDCYSQQPKPQPIKYRGVDNLSDMLVHDNQTLDILYYEVLDIPLPELQGLKTLKVAFHHSTKDEVVINTIRLPKQSTVGDVINDLKTKVELSHPNAELRLLEVFYHKIFKIFPLNEKIENVNDQYWTLRAEEIPEEEKNLGPHDRLIHVYHFMKDTAQNQVKVQNFGEPFLLVIHEGETLAEVKVRIQKKLQVPEEEFLKWKFAFLSLDRLDYLQDSDIVSNRFQRRDVYGAWDQYLGLEHSGKVRFLSCWVSSEAFLLLEKIHRIDNGTFVKFSMKGQVLRTRLLESFASFIMSMSSTKVNDVSEEALQLAAISIEDFEQVGLDLWWLKKMLGEAKTVKKYSESVNTVDSCGSALEVARGDFEVAQGDLQVAEDAFEVALAKVHELEEGLANAKAEVEVMSSRELPTSVGVNDFVLKDIV